LNVWGIGIGVRGAWWYLVIGRLVSEEGNGLFFLDEGWGCDLRLGGSMVEVRGVCDCGWGSLI